MDVKNNNKTMKGGFGAHDKMPKTGGFRKVTKDSTYSYSNKKPIPTPAPSSVTKGGARSKKTKKAKKSKKPMPKDSAYCLRCQKVTKMLSQKERTTKNGRKQVVGKGECSHEVFRFI